MPSTLKKPPAALVAEHSALEQTRHVGRQTQRGVRFVGRVPVDVVHDRAVDVPADEVDRGERRQRAARVRPDEALDEHGPVLLGELRRLVEHLEADAVAREAGRVGRADHDAAEHLVRVRVDELDERRIGLLACDELGPDDHVRWVEEVQPEEVLAEGVAAALGERVDRQAARDGGDDRVGAAELVDALEHLALQLEVLGEGLEDDVRLRDGGVEVPVVVARVGAVRDRARPDGLDGGLEPLLGLVLGAGQERDLRPGRREEGAAPVPHGAIGPEDDHVIDSPAPEEVVHFCFASCGGLHPRTPCDSAGPRGRLGQNCRGCRCTTRGYRVGTPFP